MYIKDWHQIQFLYTLYIYIQYVSEPSIVDIFEKLHYNYRNHNIKYIFYILKN